MKNYEQLINEEYSIIQIQKNYLNDTDYKLLRELDGGEPMDAETKSRRAEARSIINKCEEHILSLQKEQELNEQTLIENGSIED